MADLFRTEASDHARHKWGSPTSQLGVSSWLVTAFLISIFVIAAFFFSTIKYTKKETVIGTLVLTGGIIPVSAPRNGIVRECFVKNGQLVKQGQKLFSLNYDVTLEDGELLSKSVNALTQAQLDASDERGRLRNRQIMEEIAALNAKSEGLQSDLYLQEKQKEIQSDREILLRQTVESSRELFEKKYMSAVQFRQRQDALLQSKQVIMQIEQSIGQTRSQISQLARQRAALQMQAFALDAEQSVARADVQEKRLAALSTQAGNIVAARDGRIASIQTSIGDAVSTGQNLAKITPSDVNGASVAHLWAPSRAVGFVREGDRVRLMFDSFPYQTFGIGTGRVVEVSTAPVMPNEIPVPIETREQMYKIVVALDSDEIRAYGRTWSLSPGMRLSADLVLDERSMLAWFLDPLIAIRKRSGG